MTHSLIISYNESDQKSAVITSCKKINKNKSSYHTMKLIKISHIIMQNINKNNMQKNQQKK